MEHRTRALDAEHLPIRNRPILPTLVIAEREVADTAVRVEARPRVRHVVRRIGDQHSIDDALHQRLVLRSEIADWNTGEHALPPLQLDRGLHRLVAKEGALLLVT